MPKYQLFCHEFYRKMFARGNLKVGILVLGTHDLGMTPKISNLRLPPHTVFKSLYMCK